MNTRWGWTAVALILGVNFIIYTVFVIPCYQHERDTGSSVYGAIMSCT